MTKEEVILLLKQNGYAQHPVFKFYYIPNNSLSRYFLFNDENSFITGKLKWGQIDLKEYKSIKIKEFTASKFGLKTELDRKREALMMQRVAVNRNKAKKFMEPKIRIPDTGEEEGVNN